MVATLIPSAGPSRTHMHHAPMTTSLHVRARHLHFRWLWNSPSAVLPTGSRWLSNGPLSRQVQIPPVNDAFAPLFTLCLVDARSHVDVARVPFGCLRVLRC